MKQSQLISAYTPSNMNPELRETLFVQRHKLLSKTVSWLADSVTSGDKHHLLFVGPRGCGKTLMVSMAEYRISQIDEIQPDLRIVWLGEDDVITGFVDLALAILNTLVARYPDEFNHNCQTQAVGIPPDDAADIILRDIIVRLGNKTLLLIIENLDFAFRGLQDGGQKKWRAFLQETQKITTLASSQQLFDGVSSRHAAFFGFFDIHHLAPLNFEDAHQLIRNIALHYQKTELVDFLDTSAGRYRVRALHHLAGGNHRLYTILSTFLTNNSLDGLVEALEGLADELTPFFQERIRSLPPQQARIVQWLCDFGGAASVKTIAQSTFIQERNVSKQLGELRKKAYVISEKRGKESYVELAEPLMRLSMEAKNQRGKPLRLIVSFLKVWFAEPALGSDRVASAIDKPTHDFMAQRLADYRQAALDIDDGFLVEVKQGINKELGNCIANHDWDKAKMLAGELMAADPAEGYYSMGVINSIENKLEDSIAAFNKVIKLTNSPNILKQKALVNRAIEYIRLGQNSNAIEDYLAILNMEEISKVTKAQALVGLGITYRLNEEYNKEIDCYSKALKTDCIPVGNRTSILFRFASLTWTHQSLPEAKIALINAFEKGDKEDPHYGSNTSEIITTIATQQSDSWASTIEWLIPLYTKHQCLDKLSAAITQSISKLATIDFHPQLIEKWNLIWQQQGADIEELTIALQSLDAAATSLIDGNDRPLFKLPKEIREVVRPLLGDIFEGT